MSVARRGAMAERLAEALDVHADERATFVLVARGERLIERLLPVCGADRAHRRSATRAWTRRAAGFADDAVRPRYGTAAKSAACCTTRNAGW